MKPRIRIFNGRLLDPAQHLDQVGDLYIADGKIISLLTPPADFTYDHEIDAADQYIFPGLTDLGISLNHQNDIDNAMLEEVGQLGVKNALSALCILPDSSPIIDNLAVVTFLQKYTANHPAQTSLYPVGALTFALDGKILADMQTLKTAGCIAVSNGRRPFADLRILRHSMEYATSCDLKIWIFPEDPALKGNGLVHEGIISTKLGLPGIPETAETVAISYILLLAEQTGTKVHFCRISTARSVELIATAKQRGLPISADVGISHLHLDDISLLGFNTYCHFTPPLRKKSDRDALQKGVSEGTIDAICSDHMPYHPDTKKTLFNFSQPGTMAMPLLLPLALDLVVKKKIPLNRMISALTDQPAKIAGIKTGTLKIGADADLCIIDINKGYCWSKNEKIDSRPFVNQPLPGQIGYVFKNGLLVYQIS